MRQSFSKMYLLYIYIYVARKLCSQEIVSHIKLLKKVDNFKILRFKDFLSEVDVYRLSFVQVLNSLCTDEVYHTEYFTFRIAKYYMNTCFQIKQKMSPGE